MINSPPHYIGSGGLEVIAIVEGYGLGAHLAQAVQYILRAGRKSPDPREDLRKAAWWMRRASQCPLGSLKAAMPPNPTRFDRIAREFSVAGRRADAVCMILCSEEIGYGWLQFHAEALEAEAARGSVPSPRLPSAYGECA